MKLVFACLYILLFIYIWRALTKRRGLGGKWAYRLQDYAHTFGHHHYAILFQWYFFAAVGLLFLMLVTLIGAGYYVCRHWLSDDIPEWLRKVSKGSIAIGVIAFAGVAYHFTNDTIRGKSFRKDVGLNHAWSPSARQDMMLIVIAVPAIFVVMSVRSTSRMWMVINGDFDEYGEVVDKALYQENLDFAAVCQYIAVYQFSCLSYEFVVERASQETAQIIKRVGFLGVRAWVLVGILISIYSFAMAYCRAHYHTTVDEFEYHIQMVRAKLDDAFMAMTVLCVYNMYIICNFEYLKNALGNANLKFLGTRALLLAAQIQPKIVQMPLVMSYLGLNRATGQLLHSSLLTIECLFVVAFDYYAWEYGVNNRTSLYTVDLWQESRPPSRAGTEADNDNRDCLLKRVGTT